MHEKHLCRFFAAQEGWVYVRALRGWTELWMLQDLCFELLIDPIPGRKKAAFEAAKNALLVNRRPVIIDEADKLTPALLDWVRDLADLTFAPFALVGEKLVRHKMEAERRIWSRTLRCVEFQPISAKDILFFAKQAADLTLTPDQAERLRAASDGDFRLVARSVRRLEEIMAVNKLDTVTDEAIKNAGQGVEVNDL
ncbi:MAG: ATP-binding protein [Deltaproteobacteria bacterium]|nr:ATP-binding protein [Deltaproteobacteria bacterium]